MNWSDNQFKSEMQTSILLDQHKNPKRIGLDAVRFYKEQFAELTDWYFFENFGMPLYDEKVSTHSLRQIRELENFKIESDD